VLAARETELRFLTREVADELRAEVHGPVAALAPPRMSVGRTARTVNNPEASSLPH